MSNAKQTRRVTLASRDTLLHMLETLPDAFFVVDDTETIVYANASAQAMPGATRETFVGNAFWRCAPQLVSTALYQAVRTTRQTREPTEVEYCSPVTQSWLHVHLAPTVGGLILHFHEVRAPAQRQEMFPQGERLSLDDLDGLQTRIGILTPEGIVLDINAVPLDEAHVQREEVIGKPLAETPWWSFAPASQEQLRAAIARANTGETARFEALVCPRQGMVLHFEVAVTPHADADHQIEYLVIAGIDITARKRAEAEIHALIDAIPQLVWTGRPDGYVDSYNQRWRDYTGLTTEEAQGDGWMQCTHPDDRQRVLAVWQRAVQTGEPYETEQRLRQSTTGVYRWFLVQAVPYKDDQGTILKYVGTCTDIDDRKRAEQRLKASEENWRVLAETVPQLVWATLSDGSVAYWNHRWYDYIASSPKQSLGHAWSQFLHPDDDQQTLTVWHHALATGEPYEIEYRLKEGQTGAYRWFLARGMPVRDEAGQIVKWFGTCTDIHDKKQAEDDIRALVDALPQLVWIARPDGYATYHNQRLIAYMAMTLEQAEGDGWLAGVHPDDRQRVRAVWQTSIQTGVPYEVELRLQDGTSGAYRWFLVRGVPQRDAQGTILHWVGTCTDIHDKKQAEDEIRVLVDAIPQLVWMLRPDGYSEYGNQRWCDYTGMTSQQYQGDGWLQAIHPDDSQHTLTLWHQALETGEPFETEYRLKEGQTGAYRWFLARAMPVRDETGQILKWFGTCTDIHDKKQAEDEIRVLVEVIPQLIWIMRPDGSAEYANHRWCDYTTMTSQQYQGYGWLQAIHPDDRQHVLAGWQSAVQAGRPYEAEQRLRNGTTGDYRWFLARGAPFKDAQGTILKYFGTTTDIHEQKQAEERIKTSEENWRVLAETVPQLVWTTRAEDGLSDYFNQRFCDYTHATWEQLYGYGWSQFLHPDDYELTLAARAHAFCTGTPYEVEYRFREGQTGLYRWFLARALPVRDEAGQIVKWFGTCTDIEDKKQAEEELRTLVDAIPHFVWIMSPDGSCDYCNQQWCDYTTMTPEQLQGDGWIACLHPDDRQRTLDAWQTAVRTQTLYEVEYRMQQGRTGDYRWFLARGMPRIDSQGTILQWFGTCTDIEDQKRTEQRLKESEENWQTLAETVPQLVWRVQPDGRVDYVNQRACDYGQTTREQLLGYGWHSFLHPDDKERERVTLDHAFRTGIPYEVEFRLREGQTGCYRWFLTRGMPVCDETGQVIKWFGTCTDIEDQKRTEEALRQSQARARALIDSNIIGIVSVEAEGEVLVEANEEFLHMTGYTQEDMRSRTLNRVKITPPEHAPFFQRASQEVNARGRHTPLETEVICKDGSRLPVLVGSVTFQQRPRQNISFVLDNSARKELEQRKDDFISMASHELKTPLTALKLQTALLHRQLAKQGIQDAAPALSRMETQINKVTRLVEELLDVSKIQAGRLEYLQETVDLEALLREITDTMQQTNPSHTLVVRGTVGTSLIGDPDRLGQVFANLLSNAIKYSPDAKTVEIDLSTSEETVTIRVHDHGLGIPREQRDKIFERFYRATGPQQRAIAGLGMGLYIVAEIVKRHGGTITVDSTVGKGSTFMVTLPLTRNG